MDENEACEPDFKKTQDDAEMAKIDGASAKLDDIQERRLLWKSVYSSNSCCQQRVE